MLQYIYAGYDPFVIALYQNIRHCLFRRHLYSKTKDEHVTHLQAICHLLCRKLFYINLKKCIFMSSSVVFLGFIISTERVKMDPEKVKAVLDWLLPTTVTEVRSFHELATFHRSFNSITAPITEYLKKSEFEWTNAATQAFEQIKRKITEALIMCLPDFDKVFEVTCDASNVGIGGVLSQKGHPIAFTKRNSQTRSTSTLLMLWSSMLLFSRFAIRYITWSAENLCFTLITSHSSTSIHNKKWEPIMQSEALMFRNSILPTATNPARKM